MDAIHHQPEGIHAITAELVVDGCAEAIAAYQKVFGAVEKARAPDPSGKKIWHADIAIGDSHIFLCDTAPEMGTGRGGGGRLWIYCPDPDETIRRAEAQGFKVLMPPTDMFWGDRMGKVADLWGNEWTVAKHLRNMTPAEMQKAQEAFVASMKP